MSSGGAILKEDIVIICEGDADKNFLDHLIKDRALPSFDVISAGGIGNLTRRLEGLRGNPAWFEKLKAVIIIADSCNDSVKTFRLIKKLIKSAGQYDRPTTPLEFSSGTPKIAVLFLPSHNEPGGLESICFEALVGQRQWLLRLIDTLLGHADVNALHWAAEKVAKARFSVAVAATYEADPSKAISQAFVSNKGQSPLLSTEASAFDRVAEWLTDLSVAART